MTAPLNGASVVRSASGTTTYVKLPRELWTPINGGCSCLYCSAEPRSARPAFWDTLAIDTIATVSTAWTVHAPELHGARRKS